MFQRCMKFSMLLLLPALAHGLERPEWTRKTPLDDITFKYYLGRVSEASNEMTACSGAFKDAFESAIRSNFGFRAQIQSESYGTEKSVSATVRYDESTQEARLQGFEKVDEFVETTPEGRINCYGLYRFPKVEIENEKLRLQSIHDEVRPEVFSIQGNQSEAFKGTLEITSKPSGATVYIAGERYGKTPLRLIGQLEAGQYDLRLDHPQYESIDERVTVTPNATVSVQKTLVKASGTLNVETIPSGASLLIDGRPVGLSPLARVLVDAGIKHRLEISHPEAEKYSREFEVEKGETVDLKIPLPLKPAFLSVFTQPGSATIQIDSKELQSPLTSKQLVPGLHQIVVKKDGYVPYETAVQLRGNERLSLPIIRLISLSEEAKLKQEALFKRARYLSQNPWIFSLGVGYSDSSLKDSKTYLLSLHGSIEKKFWGWIGLKVLMAGHSYSRTETQESKTGTPNTSETFIKDISATEWSVSAPIYFYEKIYVAPEYGTLISTIKQVTRTYSVIGNGNDSAPSEMKIIQNFFGAYLGYSSFRDGIHPWGWYGEAGWRIYNDAENLKGASGVLGSFGLLYRF